VGSVGVISATFGATQAATRLGIERRVYTAGDAKVQLDPFLPVTPEAVSV
jgi:ClpP class serine protease